MFLQDIEDLFKSKKYEFSTAKLVQDQVNKVVADLTSESKTRVVVRIFARNSMFVNFVVGVPDKNGSQKQVQIQYKPSLAENEVEVEYYDNIEVETFKSLIN